MLFATNPFTVGLTHGTVPINGCNFVQSEGCSTAPVATASARKNVPTANFERELPVRGDAHALPSRELRLRRAADDRDASLRRAADRACVTEPVTSRPGRTVFAEMVTAPGAISAGATTAPAVLGFPLPGLYGTQEAIQAPLATLLKTPLIVSSALYTFAPNVARPGVPDGHVRRRQADRDERRAELRLRAA